MVRPFARIFSLLAAFAGGCNGNLLNPPSSQPQPIVTQQSNQAPQPLVPTDLPAPALPNGLLLPVGFAGSTIAHVPGARELAALPNGDLLVATSGNSVFIVPNAESAGTTGTPSSFVTLNGDQDAQGVAFGPDGNVYVSTTQRLWKVAYQSGALTGSNPQLMATYRQGPIAPNSDGDVHRSASVAVSSTTIYIGIGSSCNACVEVDPTRATIQQLPIGGGAMTTLAVRIRNPIALAVNPATAHLWAGGAGQDSLAYGHPYEFMDDVSSHAAAAQADYGWPDCEENQHAYGQASCSATVAPLLEFPAYSTHIGAVFYPAVQSGAYAFPASKHGGLFVTSHGSWHCCPSSIPTVAFVPMQADMPAMPVDWNNPAVQWQNFLFDENASTGSAGYRYRFTGIAVGAQGSLFIADDGNGMIYRIRPTGASS